MIELQGKYNTAKVFTDIVDNATVGQVIALMNQESIKDSQVRIMSDCHAGAGCVIGTTMTITDKVIPNLVGVDIGCGMLTIRLKEKRIDLPKLDSIIRKNIPSGFSIRDKIHKFMQYNKIEELYCYKQINSDRAEHSLGTLGGGNHFIEIDKDDEDDLYLVIHTGSRHLGKQIAEYYQEQAWNQLQSVQEQDGNQKKVPHELAYCTGELFDQYIHDMIIAQKYAYWNRQAIKEDIVESINLHIVDLFDTIHNYIDTDHMILRKGAVSARQNERLLIPINMRDGSLICNGKGNDDWNQSAPHGAGRLLSRSEAKQSITLSEFKKTMKEAGIYSTSVCKETIDESPMAYKSMDSIVDNIQDTVTISRIIKPIYNFKAGGE